nr:hypothetical protein B0A51_09488 [Rachicladosporium sp. CCFEE 5018]
MSRLEWVSLRRIGYARSFDEFWLAAGAEVLDDEPPGESESDSSEEDYVPVAGPSNATPAQELAGASSSDEIDLEGDSDTDDEHGPDAHELDFPPLDSPITPASATWCNCNGKAYSDSVEHLGDNGFTIASGHNILPDLRNGRPDTSGRHGYTKLPPWKSPLPDGQLKAVGSNYTRALVLARTKAEKTTWVDLELSDMLASGLLTTAIYVADDPTAPLHPPRNKGHEAMIYLSYIIDHYDALPDFSIFMHGHQFAWHNNEILDTDAVQMIRHLSPERVMRLGYMNLRCHWEPGCPAWLHPGVRERLSWKQEEHLIADSWAQIFPKDPIPTILAQPCCAQFAVSRERILATPKQRYVYLRDWLLRTELSDYLSGRVFEYIWQYVFTSSPSHCPSMSECYCDGYGFCFGSPEAFDYWFELQYNLNEAKNELQLWWKKADMIEEVKLRSPTGKVAQEADLDIPRVGRDEELEEEIKKIWAEMNRRKDAAFELGRNPAQRALEAGRTWRDGDGATLDREQHAPMSKLSHDGSLHSTNDPEKAHDDASKDLDRSGSSGDEAGEKVTGSAAQPATAPAAGPPGGPPGGPPPNGGAQAWLQVLGGFFLFFNTWGVLNTFGVYQTYYESGQLFTATSSDISWIGSIQSFMVLLVGCFTGPVFDRGYLRHLLIAGTFLIVFGHMMLSLTHTFWQALLAQGFCIGIGGGLLFVPAVAILPTYWTTKIGLAIGIAASGSSTGGIIYPIVFYRLISQIGFAWSVRVLGFMALATLVIPIIVMRQRVKPPKARAIFDPTMFTDIPFLTFGFGAFLGFIGLYVEFFYISFYGQATGITSDSMSFYLVPILNAGSVFGRTLPNILSDKIGPFNVIIPGAFVCGILVLCNITVHNLGGIVTQALLFGFWSGIFIALPPVIFVALTKDKSNLGTRIGCGFALFGCGVLAGGPGAGGVLGNDDRDLHWKGVWTYGGVVLLAAGAVFLALRFMLVGAKLKVKV